MILIVIKIGTVETLNSTNIDFIPDDRQTTKETIGGIVVQDLGRVPEGDKFSCSVEVTTADAEIIFNYWNNRIRVPIIDGAGKLHQNMRVVVKKFSHIENYEDEGYKIDLEFWRK